MTGSARADRDPAEEAARRQVLLQLLSRCRDLPWPDQRSGSELQAELYDETGLPA
jgi:hypothetical protein